MNSSSKSRQINADLQESKFKNSDPIPTPPINKVLPLIAEDPATSLLQQSAEQSRISGILPEGKPGNESGELAVCNETRQEQIQNQRKRTKKISAAAESDFIIAGEQAEFPHSTQVKEQKQCRAACGA